MKRLKEVFTLHTSVLCATALIIMTVFACGKSTATTNSIPTVSISCDGQACIK